MKQIRNHWHRDDPCLTAVIVGAMAVLALAYSIAAPMVTIEDYRYSLVLLTFQNVLKFLLIHFLLFGVMMSAMCKLIAESLMVKSDKKISSSGGTGGGFS